MFMKKRIWELDAFRGLCILGMLFVHICFDLLVFGILEPGTVTATIYTLLSQWGGILFFLISGICVTLGHHPIKRGLQVFGCGLLCTAATLGMYLAGIMGRMIIIYFGVLHCLGICMLLWPVLRKSPTRLVIGLSVLCIGIGFWLRECRAEHYGWVWLGIMPHGFITSDYYPILPNLGYFLAGIALGKTLYRHKESLFPRVNPQNPLIRFLSFFGTYSLPIYILHQPLIYGLFFLVAMIL